MANIYVNSADGSDADNGTTWALSKATATGAAAIDTAGDTINFASTHSESSASTLTLAFAGTGAAPVRLLSVSTAAEPPTTLAAGASITTTGSVTLNINGSVYADGMSFTSNATLALCGGDAVIQHYKDCDFKITGTGSSGILSPSANNFPSKLVMEDCTFFFSGTGNRFNCKMNMTIRGGSFKSGTTTPTNFLTIGSDGRGGTTLVEGFDFSNVSSGINLVSGASLAPGLVVFRNCKLPASWSGSLLGSGIAGAGMRAEMHNCDNADTNYRLWVEDFYGSIKTETVLVRTGGSSDGTTGISWKMASSASANYPAGLLISPEIAKRNSVTGSPITVTVDVLRDSTTNLTDSEMWLEVQYLGTSGTPISSFISDVKTDIFTTAADQSSSSATWTTTGMSDPNKQKLAVTFTPQEAGMIQARVVLAKASTTVYVDPLLQVT